MVKDEGVALFPLELERGMIHPAEVGHWQTPEPPRAFRSVWKSAGELLPLLAPA